MKLNLGAGTQPLEGYENLDHKTGQEIFPLDFPDGSAEEIRASHVLEHFSHRDVSRVVHHWVAKLAPGGCLKIAVPDFEWICRQYQQGAPIPVQAFVCGDQKDEDSFHGTIFDKETLDEVLVAAGLERLGSWKSEIQDCADLPVSLNRMGYKPTSSLAGVENIRAIVSVPRFGPTMHSRVANRALARLRIPYTIGTGAYWHQVWSETVEELIADPAHEFAGETAAEFILSLDYDTIFSAQDVLELFRLAKAFPEADAIVPLQTKRGTGQVLAGLLGATGAYKVDFAAKSLLPLAAGHFGCTLLRADALRRLPRPWMVGRPNAAGRYQDGKVDADIEFWENWRNSGLTIFLATKVAVGHLEEVITWPDENLRPVRQSVSEYEEAGIPAEVRRK